MLVLSRRVGETIHIGGDIVIHVTRTNVGRVTLGIEAPRSIGILRGELQQSPRETVSESTPIPPRRRTGIPVSRHPSLADQRKPE